MTAPFLANGEARIGRFPPWAWPLVPIAVSGFFVSALTWFRLRGAVPSDDDGPLAHLVIALYRGIGFESLFMVAVLVLAWSSIAFLTGRVERPWSRLARIAALGLCLSILVSLRIDGTVPASAGTVGAFLAARLSSVFGTTLSILLVAVASLASLVLATDFFFYRQFEGLARATATEPEVGPSTVHVGVEREAVAELESLRLDLPEPAAASEALAGEPTILFDDDELARAVDGAVLDLEREADVRRDPTEDAERAEQAPASEASEAEVAEAWVSAEDEPESEGEEAEDREAEEDEEADAEDAEVWASAEDEEGAEDERESEDEDAEDREAEEDEEADAEDAEVWASAEDEEGAEDEPESEDEDAEDREAEEDEEADAEDVEAWASAEDEEAAEEDSESEDEDAEDWEAEEDEEVAAEDVEAWASAEAEEAVEEEPESEDEDAEDWEAEEGEDAEAEDAEAWAAAEDEEGAEDGAESEEVERADESQETEDWQPAPEAEAIEVPELAEDGAGHREEAEAAADEDRSWVVPRPAGGRSPCSRPVWPMRNWSRRPRSWWWSIRRASVNFLKRRLRVSQDEAVELMAELQRRGVIECEVGAKTGRVLGPAS